MELNLANLRAMGLDQVGGSKERRELGRRSSRDSVMSVDTNGNGDRDSINGDGSQG